MTKKLLVVHRRYGLRGGEDLFLDEILVPALREIKMPFEVWELPQMFSRGHILASLWEVLLMALGFERLRPSYFQGQKLLQRNSFTDVLFNNFVPTVSLALPKLAAQRKIKCSWWLHNMRISCANGLTFDG